MNEKFIHDEIKQKEVRNLSGQLNKNNCPYRIYNTNKYQHNLLLLNFSFILYDIKINSVRGKKKGPRSVQASNKKSRFNQQKTFVALEDNEGN